MNIHIRIDAALDAKGVPVPAQAWKTTFVLPSRITETLEAEILTFLEEMHELK